jgi:pyruvate ferredoxin oxidoreductase alpha subunit
MKQILEGSRSIALTVKNIKPAVVSAYPITPQTHIVEDLALFKSNGEADYEYVRAESEFAAASIVEGSSAAGVRVYTATSSQGLLLMNEVVYNIAGMRLPVVMTVANRGVSAPITIWNDQQDAMSVRDAGWIMLFSENSQEAVIQHILAYKIAENLKIPVMVNVDGYVLTHTYEPVIIPTSAQIKKFLPDYKPAAGEYLDPSKPVTFGAFAAPPYYMEIREELHRDMLESRKFINDEYDKFILAFPELFQKTGGKYHHSDNGMAEYYGPKNPKTILIAMGSVAGTIKDAIDEHNRSKSNIFNSVGILKIKCFRPFPKKDLVGYLSRAKYACVLEKAVSLGNMGPLALEIRSAAKDLKVSISSYVIGLGGRDVTKEMIHKAISGSKTMKNDDSRFMGK